MKPLFIFRTPNLFPLALIIFIDNLSFYIVIPVLMRLLLHGHHGMVRHLTRAERQLLFGITVALSPVVSMIAAPFIGGLSDAIGRRKTLLFCLFGTAIAFLLPIIGLLNRSIVLIVLGRAIAGVSDCSQSVAQAAIADMSPGEGKARNMGVVQFSSAAALVLGPLLGTVLSDHHLFYFFNYTTPYYLGLILALFNIVLLLEFFKETRVSRQARFHFSQVAVFGKAIFKQKHLVYLLLSFFLLQFGWAEYYQNNYIYLTSKCGFTISEVGVFLSCVGLFVALSLLFVYPIVIRHVSLKKAYRYSVAAIALLLCLVFIPTKSMQWLVAIMLGPVGAIAYVGGVTLFSDAVPQECQGWMMGTLALLISLSWFLSGILPSIIAQVSILLAVGLAALLLIGSTILLFMTNFEKAKLVQV